MAPALPIIKPRQCIRALERAGFYIHHQSGSHARLLHRTRADLRVTVPTHNKDLPRGTLRNILRQADLSADELLELL
jgi:predicted RNA binding protein YcfA (HicA-like mRNA interferase family)